MPRTTSPARRATNHRTRIRPSTCSATKIAVRRAHPVRGLPAMSDARSSSSAVVCALPQTSSSSIHRPLRSFLACLELPSPPPPRASGTTDTWTSSSALSPLAAGTVLPYLSSSRILHPSLAGRTWSSTASRSIPTNVWGLTPRTTTSFARSSTSTGL